MVFMVFTTSVKVNLCVEQEPETMRRRHDAYVMFMEIISETFHL
jgi:hypothetical protein